MQVSDVDILGPFSMTFLAAMSAQTPHAAGTGAVIDTQGAVIPGATVVRPGSAALDWGEKYPSHVVAKWLGHSPNVAAQHYLMSRDRHFEDVVGGESSPSAGADGGAGEPVRVRREMRIHCDGG
jgi:hypothetical protein